MNTIQTSNGSIYKLEDSNHPHFTTSNIIETYASLDGKLKVLNANNSIIIEHGEHRIIATDPTTQHIIKIPQQEFNPISKLMQDSSD